MTIKTIKHFEPGDLDGDYLCVEIQIDGQRVVVFGDGYHEQGQTRAEAWIQGYLYAQEHQRTDDSPIDDEEEDVDDGKGHYDLYNTQ